MGTVECIRVLPCQQLLSRSLTQLSGLQPLPPMPSDVLFIESCCPHVGRWFQLTPSVALLQESRKADAATRVTSTTGQQHGPEQAEINKGRTSDQVQEHASNLHRWVSASMNAQFSSISVYCLVFAKRHVMKAVLTMCMQQG